jgi:hypothetical protein
MLRAAQRQFEGVMMERRRHANKAPARAIKTE